MTARGGSAGLFGESRSHNNASDTELQRPRADQVTFSHNTGRWIICFRLGHILLLLECCSLQQDI